MRTVSARRWHGGWRSGGRSTSGAASPGLARRPTTSRSASPGSLARDARLAGAAPVAHAGAEAGRADGGEARLDDPPILLLDDVPSELDPRRRGLLFEVITKLDCQTLISVTEREIVPVRTYRLDFQVRAGRITGFPDTGFTLLTAYQMLDTWKRSGL